MHGIAGLEEGRAGLLGELLEISAGPGVGVEGEDDGLAVEVRGIAARPLLDRLDPSRDHLVGEPEEGTIEERLLTGAKREETDSDADGDQGDHEGHPPGSGEASAVRSEESLEVGGLLGHRRHRRRRQS